MAVCSIESDEGGLSLDAAPSKPNTPIASNPTPSFIQSPMSPYYGGGG